MASKYLNSSKNKFMLKNRLLKLKQKINQLRHSGSAYQCPICGYKTNNFYKIGLDFPVIREKQIIGAGRRNGGCYKCNSSDRERLVFTFLVKKINLFNRPKTFKILHLEPEKNISKKIFNFGFEDYICGDLFSEGYTNRYPEYVQNMNILDIPF